MANVCRFCLKSGGEFEEIEDLLKDLLDALLLNLNLKASKCPVICKNCSNRIHEMFNFKTVCLYSEDALHPFINTRKGPVTQLNLLSVYSKTKLPDPSNLDNVQICRLCLEITKDSVNLENETVQIEFGNVFRNHFPEIGIVTVEFITVDVVPEN